MVEFRELELEVRPAELLEHGHSPGPAIGRALDRTLAARLDGEIEPEGELDYALGVLEALSSTSVPNSQTE